MAKIALVGGTGDLGKALCLAWCRNNQVVIGSRKLERALETLNLVRKRMEELGLSGYSSNLSASTNGEAVKNSSIIILAIPHNVDQEFILELAQNISMEAVVVSSVSPVIREGDHFRPAFRFKGNAPISFAEWVKDLLQGRRVVSALHTFPATRFYREGRIQCDIPVAGDDTEAVRIVMNYINQIEGARPLYVGPLTVSLQLELMTLLLLNLQRFAKLRSPAVRFV